MSAELCIDARPTFLFARRRHIILDIDHVNSGNAAYYRRDAHV